MGYYYIAFFSRSHSFLLERRLTDMGIKCELTYLPREIMTDLCNMGVRFEEDQYEKSVNNIIRSGLPNYRIYKEEKGSNYCTYTQIKI